MFAATELWVFHIQVGREAQSISISEIPLVLALFYAMPEDLLIARVVGPALVMLLHRRQTMLKAAVNIALLYADTAVALAVFCWVGGGSTADSGPTWVAAVLAASAAMAVDLIVINTIIRWYDGGPRLARVRSVVNGVGIAAASATLGLVPLLTLRLGSLAAVPLLAAGCCADGRLPRLRQPGRPAQQSRAAVHASVVSSTSCPSRTTCCPRCSPQARDLLRGETAEIVRFDEPGVTAWRSVGGRAQLLPPDEADEAGEMVRRLLEGQEPLLLRSDDEAGADYLRLRNAGEALLAPLRYDGRMVGAIAVHDRLGEVRGFSSDDLQLLQTVANHASVALHNEMLIGRLRHDALHDTLTGLANRAQLVNEATAQLLHARTRQQSIAVMIIDLNGFKTVNDTLGHHVGDELLRDVADRFVLAAGHDVTVARLGGDEFAILCQAQQRRRRDGRRHHAARLARASRSSSTRNGCTCPARPASPWLPSTARPSATCSSARTSRCTPPRTAPDSALVYRSDIDVNDPSLLSLMGELREGIATGQVDIEVEPVVDLFTGAVVSAEALVRWHHPTRGKLRPGLFLPLAERNGLIVPLTELVLDRAVAACASWRADGGDEIGISVNLSARSLLDTMLPGRRRRRAAPASPAQPPAHPGDHRDHHAQRRRPRARAARRPAGAGRPPLARRLRHRLLLADPPVRTAHPAAEDRPVVRQPDHPVRPGTARSSKPSPAWRATSTSRWSPRASRRPRPRAAARPRLPVRPGPLLRAVDERRPAAAVDVHAAAHGREPSRGGVATPPAPPRALARRTNSCGWRGVTCAWRTRRRGWCTVTRAPGHSLGQDHQFRWKVECDPTFPPIVAILAPVGPTACAQDRDFRAQIATPVRICAPIFAIMIGFDDADGGERARSRRRLLDLGAVEVLVATSTGWGRAAPGSASRWRRSRRAARPGW